MCEIFVSRNLTHLTWKLVKKVLKLVQVACDSEMCVNRFAVNTPARCLPDLKAVVMS